MVTSALTKEQKDLVEKNHNVIYAVSRKEGAPISDFYGVGALALCKAAQSFNGNPENFYNYAFVAVKRAFWAEFKRRRREVPVAEIFGGQEEPLYEQAEARADLSRLLKMAHDYLTPKEKKALQKALNGLVYSESSSYYRAVDKLRKVSRGEPIETRRKHDRAAIEQAVRLRSMGYSYEHIKRCTGLATETTKKYYRLAGRPFRGTSADVARLLNVDRSTVLRHAKKAVKIGQYWKIVKIPVIRKTAPKSQKCYTEEELALLKSGLPDSIVAERLGRTENAVHIKRWRMKKQ